MKIGSLQLQSNVLLSPLEGVSDIGFRQLCYQNGAGITWTEMIRASGIVRRNKATLDLIDTHDPSTLTGIQLFVANERELSVTLYQLEQLAFSSMPHLKNIRAVDLNFGCPSPEIIRIGAGPALLKRTNKMSTIFKVLHDWKGRTSLDIGAVGVKIRLGLTQMEQDHKVYLRLLDAANAQLDYLTVHARHAKQMSRDIPSWNAIKEVKELATIPIIGNGDVFGKASAEKLFAQTKCDGIMVARAAIQSPWIFRELTGKGAGTPSPEELEAAERTYFDIAKKYSVKEKYLEFHTKNFLRMKQGTALAFPKNSNLQ
jgi:tRNA-dihydrouridine synthase B